MKIEELREKIELNPSKTKEIILEFLDGNMDVSNKHVKEFLLEFKPVLKEIQYEIKDNRLSEFKKYMDSGKFVDVECVDDFTYNNMKFEKGNIYKSVSCSLNDGIDEESSLREFLKTHEPKHTDSERVIDTYYNYINPDFKVYFNEYSSRGFKKEKFDKYFKQILN